MKKVLCLLMSAMMALSLSACTKENAEGIYTPGTYTCSYYVVDSAGNMSNTAELTVIVQ